MSKFCLSLFLQDHIIIPSRVILWYLKRIDFKDEAFVISSQMFRRELIAGGIKVIEPGVKWNYITYIYY